jgi:Leucine-rich repeat (LRR) protein
MRKGLLLAVAALVFFSFGRGDIPSGERAALLTLYASTGGDNWIHRDNWLGPAGSECTWYGVGCNDNSDHVESLSLSTNNLAGALPAALGDLPYLRYLRLDQNAISGGIPASLGGLSQLEVLDLSANLLSGPIPPQIGNLPLLGSLNLADNQLTGGIPLQLAGLSNLLDLDLSQNQLSGGIPPELGGLAHLQALSLYRNQLTGFIPPALGDLGDLRYLYLAENLLNGPVPPELGNLGQLQELYLSWNALTGGIPPALGSLAQLEVLDLSGNLLGGSIPPELVSLSALIELNLAENNLTGQIPMQLGGLTQLHSLQLGNNLLNGPVPASLGALTFLEWLDLSSNRLTDEIPPELGGLHNLQWLSLTGNELFGSLPPEMGDLANLQILYLDENLLGGYLPESLGNLTRLQSLVLAGNQFEGEIPSRLFDLTDLRSIDFSFNNLTGPLPPSVGNLQQLEILYLGGNRLDGTIPPQLGGLAELKLLVLDGNRFEGAIPPELGNLAQLRDLILGHNRLSGAIPAQLGNLLNLQELKLFGNKLSGPVPATLANLVQLVDTTGLDLNFNALHTEDPDLAAFLLQKQGMNFLDTQTLPPSGVTLVESTFNTLHLSWTPMVYQEQEGGYEILVGPSPTGPFDVRKKLGLKSAADYTDCFCGITGTVYVAVRGWTDPHGLNENRVISEPSPAVAVTPAGQPQGTVNVYYDTSRHGTIFGNSPSQILPASYLIFAIDPAAFASASSDSPVSLWISLPPGALLSQTLADGEPGTASPAPTGGETVLNLAVNEYMFQDDRPVVDLGATGAAGIGPDAVQLFRYFEGEGVVQIRFNESTAGWLPETPGNFLGFTIGIGGGFWPPDESSNWGPDGQDTQPSTQFYVNLLDFAVDQQNPWFPVQLCAFRQIGGTGAGVAFQPGILSLMHIDGVSPEPPPAASLISGIVTDFTTGDFDGDGLADTCAVDAVNQRLYWAFGQSDGGFGRLGWRVTTGYTPQRVDAADVTGDGRIDILVADSTGNLYVYDGTELFSNKSTTALGKAQRILRLADAPSDTQLADVSNDGLNDYLYTDESGNALHVLLGSNFSTDETYSTGATPRALAVGDFDGDAVPDVAVANNGGDSLSVFLNDGSGQFSGAEVSGIGSQPVGLDAADFDGDGLTDLAVVLAGDKALGVLRAQGGGQFGPAHEQKIYFQKTPSALQTENFDGANGPDALVGFADDYKLALCTTDSTGTLSVSQVIDTRGDVEVDPLNNSVSLAADQVLSVVGGTTSGGVASRQGVAVIQDAGYGVLNFPRTQDLSFSVVNLGEHSAILTLELYDQSGTTLDSASYSLAAGTQFARYLTDLLGSEAGNAQRWVRGFVTEPETYGLWLANNGADLTYLDGTRLLDIRDARTRLVFPVLQTSAGRQTALYLVNPNKAQAQVYLRRYDSDGQPQGDDHHVTLAGRGRTVLDAATVFAGLAETDSIQVTSDRALAGVEMFGDSQSLACLEGMPTGVSQGVLYSPHLAVGDFGVQYESYLSLVNTADTEASLTLTLASDAGATLSTASLAVPAHGKQLVNAATLFDLQAATTGYLRIDPGSAAGIVGSVIFGEAGAGRFLSSLPLQSAGHNRFLLGHIANGTIGGIDYFTGIAILNPEQDTRVQLPVQVSAYDQNGLLQDRRTINLGGRQRQVFLLHQLMPTLTSLFGGYIVVENLSAASGILVFELFGDTQLQFLSAVPAIPLD